MQTICKQKRECKIYYFVHVKHITWHSGRHTFATLTLTHDIDLYTVSKLLGHKEIKTTQIYAKLIDKKKDEAVDKLPFI